ncbi:glycosyl transferase family 4 [Candidatus Pacearchaeota archaeon]|nr:glycosyl transferase family 4 [Candidatus Pacearchaeota archaeon]
MEILLLLPVVLSFFLVVFLMPYWIRKAHQIELMWDDMNKLNSPKVAGSGGVVTVIGFVFGVLAYVAIKTFYFKSSNGNLVGIFAILSVILLVSLGGFIDDLFGWRKGGLSKKSRILLILFSAIPLMVINAGVSTIFIPFVGTTNLGIFYALVIIPLGVLGASATFNILAGYNGLEAGQGILILSALALMSFFTGSTWLSVIALCMISALFAFLLFNKYPAKVFPGDGLTYSVGAMAACMAILGNYEMFAVFIFIPYGIETIFKLRGRLKKQSFGLPQKDGSIKNRYDKIYGLEHLAIKILSKFKKEVYEWEVVILIYGFQVLIIALGFLIFLFNAA